MSYLTNNIVLLLCHKRINSLKNQGGGRSNTFKTTYLIKNVNPRKGDRGKNLLQGFKHPRIVRPLGF